MNKTQLIDALAARYDGNRKAAAQALESVLDTITREVARGEKVAITGFGSFEKRIREARWVRNPRTGERIMAEKTAVPKFTPGADLRNVISGAKSLPAITLAVATAPARAAAATARGAAGGAAKRAPAKSTAKTTAATETEKTAAKKTTATKATATKAPAKRTPATKTATKQTAARKSPAKTVAKKAPAKKAPAKKAAGGSSS